MIFRVARAFIANPKRPQSDVAQASRLQSSLLREAPHSIKVTALRAIDKMAGRMPALHRIAGDWQKKPAPLLFNPNPAAGCRRSVS
ncbi:hypothetical protein [Geminisphaera colitermitum]|uniref:hypothetical protein n=1 Tax=Geminisphaera colitermitum TaxID=1148786 RepID=UPI0012FEEA35|nr:hypothetical protein [Geminisphaera colitermitum]